jgi:hypothetical protein
VVLGLWEVEGIPDADHVRPVLMFVAKVVILEAVLLPWDVDLLGPRNLRAVIEPASLILYSVLPTAVLGLRVHLKVVTQVSQLFHFEG